MIMKVEKEMKYEAPEVEVLEVMVEKGFAASGPDAGGAGDSELLLCNGSCGTKKDDRITLNIN